MRLPWSALFPLHQTDSTLSVDINGIQFPNSHSKRRDGMVRWLHTLEIGDYNTLEWIGFAGLILIGIGCVILLLKRLLSLSVSMEIHRNDGNPNQKALPGGHEKILVMDDDNQTATTLKQILNNLGYEVVCMESGEQTVAYLSSNGADLVILDVMMDQGIDGIETYRRIRAIRPLQRAIMLSGSAHPDQVKSLRLLGVESYLIKPVTLPLLAHAIRAELDRP